MEEKRQKEEKGQRWRKKPGTRVNKQHFCMQKTQRPGAQSVLDEACSCGRDVKENKIKKDGSDRAGLGGELGKLTPHPHLGTTRGG